MRSLNSRGNAWKGKGELDLAIADYNAAIRSIRLRVSLQRPRQRLVQQGRVRSRDRRLQRGDPARSDLAAPYPTAALRWRDQGRIRPRAGRRQNEALRRDPKNVAIYAARGEIWRLKGDLDRALADQDQAVRLDPKSPLPFLARGDTYRYQGRAQPRAGRLRPGAAGDARLHPGLCRPRPHLRESRATSRAPAPNTTRR